MIAILSLTKHGLLPIYILYLLLLCVVSTKLNWHVCVMFAETVPVKHDLGAEAPPAQVVWAGKTIQVSGFKTSTTDNAILLFFESKKHSGGDRVEKMQRDKNKNVAYVTFAKSGG